MRSAAAVLLVVATAGCLPERERPGPLDPSEVAELTALLVTPPNGSTVPTGQDIVVTVDGRDQSQQHLEGVGFVARRVVGGQTLDSAAVRFSGRADSVHVFTFQVPATVPTNTQVDVYGIAFGPGGLAELSAPAHLTVVQCVNGVCQ